MPSTPLPFFPAEQAKHRLVQLLSQHRPCEQNPELHSAAPPQAAPMGFKPQLPLLQLLGDAQSAEVLVRALYDQGKYADGIKQLEGLTGSKTMGASAESRSVKSRPSSIRMPSSLK